MNAFVAAAIAMIVALVPLVVVMARDELMSAVVAFDLASFIIVMVLACLAQGFGRSGEFELAVLLAVLLYGSNLVFIRSLERWL